MEEIWMLIEDKNDEYRVVKSEKADKVSLHYLIFWRTRASNSNRNGYYKKILALMHQVIWYAKQSIFAEEFPQHNVDVDNSINNNYKTFSDILLCSEFEALSNFG